MPSLFANPETRRSIKVSQENFVVIFNQYTSFEDFKQEALVRTNAFAQEFSIQNFQSGPRTSEDLGLTWKSYAFDHFTVYDTAYEGELYESKVKTEDSRARIPIPRRIRPYIFSSRSGYGEWRAKNDQRHSTEELCKMAPKNMAYCR